MALTNRNFRENFSWDTGVLNADQKKLEGFPVEYHDVFAKHRFDVDYNTEIKNRLTPELPNSVYVQGPPAQIHLRDKILCEFALLHSVNTMTTPSHSKYGSRVFVHRKKSSKF